MAQYSTDFSEYATDSVPTDQDWSNHWNEGGLTTNIIKDDIFGTVQYLGGKYWHLDKASSGNHILAWDDIDSDADRDDVEMLLKWSMQDGDDGIYNIGLSARASGATSGTRTQYVLWFDGQSKYLHLRKVVNGTSTELAKSYFAGELLDGKFGWLRFRINGSSLKGKWWTEQQPEPDWQLEHTNTDITAAGWVGIPIYSVDNSYIYVDYFSAGTNGDVAPWPATDSTEVRASALYTEVAYTPVLSDVRIEATYVEVAYIEGAPGGGGGGLVQPVICINC